MIELDPATTYWLLLVVQALHLLHHRIAKRHISFAEVVAAAVLLIPVSGPLPPLVLMIAHVGLAALQIAGSLFIDRLSPRWPPPARDAPSGSHSCGVLACAVSRTHRQHAIMAAGGRCCAHSRHWCPSVSPLRRGSESAAHSR